LLAKVKDRRTIDLSRHWNIKNFLEYYYSSLAITGALYWIPQILKAEPEHSFFFNESYKYYDKEINTTADLMNIIRKMEVDIHLQRILLKVDRASMFHSLEVRVPFLNNQMLAHSQTYTYNDCIKGMQGKMNIKQSLINKAGIELVLAPKKGFTIPIDEWLRGDIKEEVTEKIMDMPANLSRLFRKKKLQELLKQHMQGSQESGWLIWALYSLVQWDAFHRQKYNKCA